MMVLLDEMHIKEGLVYNKHTGELVGFVDIGDINNHLMQVNMSLQGSRASKQALKSLSKTMLSSNDQGLVFEFPIPVGTVRMCKLDR